MDPPNFVTSRKLFLPFESNNIDDRMCKTSSRKSNFEKLQSERLLLVVHGSGITSMAYSALQGYEKRNHVETSLGFSRSENKSGIAVQKRTVWDSPPDLRISNCSMTSLWRWNVDYTTLLRKKYTKCVLLIH